MTGFVGDILTRILTLQYCLVESPSSACNVITRCDESCQRQQDALRHVLGLSCLTPCVPVASIFAFQLAESVPQSSCFPADPPMIAQLSHGMNNKLARPLIPRRVVASKAVIVEIVTAFRSAVEVMWMDSGGIVEMGVMCDAMSTSFTLNPGPRIKSSTVPTFETPSQVEHIQHITSPGVEACLAVPTILFFIYPIRSSVQQYEVFSKHRHHARTRSLSRRIFGASNYCSASTAQQCSYHQI